MYRINQSIDQPRSLVIPSPRCFFFFPFSIYKEIFPSECMLFQISTQQSPLVNYKKDLLWPWSMILRFVLVIFPMCYPLKSLLSEQPDRFHQYMNPTYACLASESFLRPRLLVLFQSRSDSQPHLTRVLPFCERAKDLVGAPAPQCDRSVPPHFSAFLCRPFRTSRRPEP